MIFTAKDFFKARIIGAGIIKEGNFTLSSGENSDFYFDFRALLGYPGIMGMVVDFLGMEIKTRWERGDYDLFCGIPLGGVFLSTLLSNKFDKPFIVPRKNKNHGTKKEIEGVFKENQKVIILDDVITSGETVLRTVEILKNQGLKILSVLTILDRQDFGNLRLKRHKIPLVSIFKLSDFR
jgi:uridine monophosphate synthetase